MERSARGRLLISHITLRGPEIEQLYQQIQVQPGISYSTLISSLSPASTTQGRNALDVAPLREALSFLLVAGLIEQEEGVRQHAQFCATDGDTNFTRTLLRRILVHPEVRQRAIQLVHRQLIADDILSISIPDLRIHVERGAYQHLFAWTGEKLLFWSQLMAHLGLVRRFERSSEVFLVPDLSFLLDSLRWAAADKRGILALNPLLRHIDDRMFACFTARGRVHAGLAQSLVALHRLRRIQLVHQADAIHSHLLGTWRVSHITELEAA